MNCPCKCTNSIDEEGDQGSTCESEFEEKPEKLASVEHLMRENGGPKRNRIRVGKARGSRANLSQPCRRRRAGVSGAEPFGATKRSRSPGVWKTITVVVDLGAAENVMPKSMFPEISAEETERSKNGKGFKGPGGEPIKNYGQQVMSFRTPEGFVRKSMW